MMNSNASSLFWDKILKILVGFLLAGVLTYPQEATAQFKNARLQAFYLNPQQESEQQEVAVPDTVPDPREVMWKSAKIPGWGQVTNEQIWKVPIVYALIGGMVYYSYTVHQLYGDYRAAAYNAAEEHDDQKFGPTPDHIDENQSLDFFQNQRNFYRNRRDLTYLLIFAAYGLNVVDAYVFAHLRDFDVSDDLSANINLNPASVTSDNSGYAVTLRFDF